ncbi:hypothetical protein D3218_12965 [Aureimonas flava]|uniref:Uncharacterized protein n=2 Tax=Aureimonas flava TaxID=2320271 RepID=A0A3A1WHX9_9HYPH|nr:hypothetical protein D3218_12965 [Aureimonas flava]
MSSAEMKALKMDYFHQISAQQARVDEEREELQRIRKLAKADKIILSDIDFMMRCAKVEDPRVIPDRIKREAEIASWFALPVLFQPDMFGDFTREPAEDAARREGHAAGVSGFGSNPHDENSASGRAWAAAWEAAQADHRANLKSAMEKKNAAKAELIEGPGRDDGADLDEGEE